MVKLLVQLDQPGHQGQKIFRSHSVAWKFGTRFIVNLELAIDKSELGELLNMSATTTRLSSEK